MEVWIDEKKPEVMSTTNVVLAIVIHLVFFIAVYTFAKFHFKPKETIIPIDLTVVVNENLDGVDDEPPPLDDPPKPEPPKPDPTPVKQPDPPPPPPVTEKVDAVVKVPDKKPEPKKEVKKPEEKKPEKKPEVKKPEPKKPEPPKKTKEELRKEKMQRMRDSAKTVKIKVKDKPSGNGRTERQTRTPEEIQKLLNQGYKPGTKTQVATSTMQYCISRVQQAIDARWSQVNPRVGAEGYVHIAVRFNMQGRMVNCRLSQSCGDKASDTAALTVVRTVPAISGLDKDFLKEFSKQDLVIRYKVVAR